MEEVYGRRYHFVHENICDLAALDKALPGHDAVVHFAAESHVDRSIASPESFAMTNCVGTNLVLHAARRAGVQRVVHISTDEVYGSVEEGSSVETDRLEPRSPYSATKAGSDLIALSYYTTYGLPVMVTRSSNNFGPWQYPEKIIPLFITNLLDGKNVPLYGDGLNQRDWLFVEDNCAAIDAGAPLRGARGDLQHRGGQRAHEPGVDRQIIGTCWRRRRPGHLCHGPVGPRPPLLDQLQQSPGARMEARAMTSTKLSGVPSLGTATTAGGGSRSSESACNRGCRPSWTRGSRTVGASPHHECLALNSAELDISVRERVLQVAGEWAPEVVINAAAFTAVDACESQVDKAFAVNALGPRNLAEGRAPGWRPPGPHFYRLCFRRHVPVCHTWNGT